MIARNPGGLRLPGSTTGTDIHIGGPVHEILDLSSTDAVEAAAGKVAGDLVATALDAFPAGAHLKPLLGPSPTGSILPLDAAHLLVDPLGVLHTWWQGVMTAHRADVPALLTHLRDLIPNDSKVALNGYAAVPISGTGIVTDPWRILWWVG